MDKIFTLWVGKTNPICRLCMESWKKLGYEITVYTDLDNHDEFIDQFNLCDYREILDDSPEDILPFSDLFRYKKLYRDGGTWVDADLFLLRKIPDSTYIITSERTAQKGAYKRSIKQIPNIGVMRFPPKCELLKEIIFKIEKSRSKSDKCQKNMFKFQDALLKSPKWQEYMDEVRPPELYCPTNWANVKEQYFSDTFTSKYGQEVNQIDWILENSIGVHLWENLTLKKYKIDLDKAHENSLWCRLKNLI